MTKVFRMLLETRGSRAGQFTTGRLHRVHHPDFPPEGQLMFRGLCANSVREFYELPMGQRLIHVHLSDQARQPHPNAYELTGFELNGCFVYVGDEVVVFTYSFAPALKGMRWGWIEYEQQGRSRVVRRARPANTIPSR